MCRFLLDIGDGLLTKFRISVDCRLQIVLHEALFDGTTRSQFSNPIKISIHSEMLGAFGADGRELWIRRQR